MKRVLITGTSGMLGKDIVNVLSKNYDFDVFGFDKVANSSIEAKRQILGDLTDFYFLKDILCEIKPEIIVHCAAIVNVDVCELNKGVADTIHYGVTNILSSFNPISTKFIYISTDSVFDGIKGNYSESDSPNPLNYYAKSKLAGEQVGMRNNSNSIIIRTNIYGFNYMPGKSLVEWALNSLSKNQPITGFTDVRFNPLYTKQLAMVIYKLIELNNFNGIINIAANEQISKYDFLILLAKTFNLPLNLIRSGSVSSVQFLAPRPQNTSLNVQLMRKNFGLEFYFWEGMKELKDDYEKYFEVTYEKNQNR